MRCDAIAFDHQALVRDCGHVTILPMRVAASECRWVCCALPIAEAVFERSVGVRWLKERGIAAGRCLIRELEGETIG
jgi:hypothetical protein